MEINDKFFKSQKDMLQWFEENIFYGKQKQSVLRFNKEWFIKRNFQQQWNEIQEILHTHNLSNYEFRYRLKNLIPWDKKFTCKVCGKVLKFTGSFHKFCSSKCMANSEEVKEKKKQTSLKRYGVENPFQSEEKKEKIKQTNLKRYGVENVFSSKEIQKRIRISNLHRHGVEIPLQSKEILEKVKQTNLEKYGVEFSSQSKAVKDKVKQTNLEKYGVPYYLQTEDKKEKSRMTSLRKYGTTHPMQSTEIQEKKIKTNEKKYGVKHVSQTDFVKQIIHEKQPEIQRKAYETKKKRKSFGTSKVEHLIFEKLKEKFPDVKTQFRSEEYPWSCDFYIPSLNLYIEFQGTWTHGKCPFDPTNQEHLALIEKWKQKSEEINFKGEKKRFYIRAIEGWTIIDPKKRNWSKEHNLNWLEFFDEDQFNGWFDTIKSKEV